MRAAIAKTIESRRVTSQLRMCSTLQGRAACRPEGSRRCSNLEGHHRCNAGPIQHFGCSRFAAVRVLDCVADFKMEAKRFQAKTCKLRCATEQRARPCHSFPTSP